MLRHVIPIAIEVKSCHILEFRTKKPGDSREKCMSVGTLNRYRNLTGPAHRTASNSQRYYPEKAVFLNDIKFRGLLVSI